MLAILSPTDPTPAEIRETNHLFSQGLRLFILRMPEKETKDYRRYLESIDRRYLDRVFVVYRERELAHSYPIGGFYLKATEALALTREEIAGLTGLRTIIGCHSVEEIAEIRTKMPVSFFLLSPLFDSISKQGYKANPLLQDIRKTALDTPALILAMGGVTPDNYSTIFEKGYSGAAVIGAVWEDPIGPGHAYEAFPKQAILSIAGHDPSGGAGIDADKETAEYFGYRCFALPTVTTVQDEEAFETLRSVDEETLLSGVRFFLHRHPEIRGIKIGMIPDLGILKRLLSVIREESKLLPILWDPIIGASRSQEGIFKDRDEALLFDCLREITLVTPNAREYEYWFTESVKKKYRGAVVVKGVMEGEEMLDLVMFSSGWKCRIPGIPGGEDRHGTGCRFSTALLSSLLSGYSLIPTAVVRAQRYVHAYRVSPEGALHFSPVEQKHRHLRDNFHLQYVTNHFSLETIEKALRGGLRWVQIRLKEATTEERIHILKEVRPLCDRYSSTLIIDDDVEAAHLGGADGVHLGKHDLSPIEARRRLGEAFIIGSTANNPEMLRKAYRDGSDYVGVGPFRFTRTKKNLDTVLGADGLREMVRESKALPDPLPLVAIGGITAEDITVVRETGVDGIAISGAIERDDDVERYTETLLTKWDNKPVPYD